MDTYKCLFILLTICFYFSCKQASKETSSSTSEDDITQMITESSVAKVLDSSEVKLILGLFTPEENSSFTLIQPVYADREGMYLQIEAYDAFIQMYNAAKADGINLQIRSATRNHEYQKGIWERKWTGETILSSGINAATQINSPKERALEILKYSSMPGTSRHHWGTDIDLNNFNNEWFESGEGLALFEWLDQNASNYGYCRPYTAKDSTRSTGYNEEKWHWSYMPLSSQLTELAATLDNASIKGFLGSDLAEEINVVDNYILGINKQCVH